MANLNIEIQISAKDQASGVLKGLKGAMGDLGGIARGVLAVGLGAATAAGGLLAAGIGLSIKEAMEAQEVFAQTEAVIKSTGGVAGITADAAAGLAESLMKVTRFGDEAILSGENLLLTFTNIGKDIFPDATEVMLDMSTALGQDLKSSAVQLGKALQDPILGVTALRRVGVNFNEEQTEMIKKMVEAGDVMGAQKFILAELKTEFGGSARAAGETLAGQLDILKNSLLNVAEGVGTSLLPLLQQFLQDVVLPLVPRIQELAEKFGMLLSTLFDAGPLSSEFGEALGAMFGEETAGKIQEIIGKVMEFAGVVKDFVLNVIVPFAQEHATELKGALIAIGIALGIVGVVLPVVGALIAAVTSPITLVIAAIALLGAAWAGNWGGIQEKTKAVIDFLRPFIEGFLAAIQDFWKEHGDEIIATVQNLWETVSGAVSAFVNWLITTTSNLVATIQGFWDAHGEQIKATAKALWDGVVAIFEFFRTQFSGIFEAFRLAFEGDWEGFGAKLREVWDAGWQAIKDIASKAWDFVKEGVRTLISNISNNIKTTDWKAVGISIVQGIAGGISAGVGWVVNAIINVAKSIMGALKGFFNANSPSKLLFDFGEIDLMKAWGSGILSGAQFPVAAMQTASAQTMLANRQSVMIFGGLNLAGVNNSTSLLEELSGLMV